MVLFYQRDVKPIKIQVRIRKKFVIPNNSRTTILKKDFVSIETYVNIMTPSNKCKYIHMHIHNVKKNEGNERHTMIKEFSLYFNL